MNEISWVFKVPHSTLHDRYRGIQERSKASIERQLLTPIQESSLLNKIIISCQLKSIPTRQNVMAMADKILQFENAAKKPLSRSWLDGFISRSKVLVCKRKSVINISRICENPENFIGLFFNWLCFYELKYEVRPSRVWNLDKRGFESGKKSQRFTGNCT